MAKRVAKKKGSKRVLIVDDHPVFREGLSSLNGYVMKEEGLEKILQAIRHVLRQQTFRRP